MRAAEAYLPVVLGGAPGSPERDFSELEVGAPLKVHPFHRQALENPAWWMELHRYHPEVMSEGLLSGCWGDSEDLNNRDLSEVISDVTGGDCDDSNVGVHRGQSEGPDDLLGIFYDDPGSCSSCVDGLDNNCNGLTDCAEPACALCFAGHGFGCGDSSESPCTRGGCNVTTTPAERRRAPGGGLIILAGLATLVGGFRMRGRRTSEQPQ